MPFGASSFGYRRRSAIRSETTCRRSAGSQPLGRDLTDLRRVEADPDFPDFLPLGPEPQEFLEVARAVDLLPRHRAVHHDLMADDVLEDAVVGGRRAARIVLGLQAVDRDDDGRNRGKVAHSFGISRTALVTSCVWMPRADERGRIVFELAVAHQRFAADDRDVKRPVPIDEVEHAVDEFLSFEVAHLAERDVAAEMIVAVRVAAGTAQRALARDLDRERGRVAGENPTPGREDRFHSSNYISDIGYP